jgi:histidyl-tRNA synthetase
MSDRVQPRLPRGMRDFMPEQMVLREHVMGVVRGVFESHGFEPLHTPSVELAQTLMGKYGPDAERLIYDVHQRQGDEELALRYDLSVPLSRVVAMNPALLLPFKRYQIAPVWRAERPQKGRYREFFQCDADIVGSASMMADAEIISVIHEILSRLRFQRYTTKVNNRKILTGIGQFAGLSGEPLLTLYRSIDKRDKIGMDGVRREMAAGGIAEDVIDRISRLLDVRGENRVILPEMMSRLESVELAAEGIRELQELIAHLDELGVPANAYQVDFSMVRGLDYYTGPIYETTVEEPKIGSITGGGRYDRLIAMFSETSHPATGTTIGIERLIDVMTELNMFPPNVGRTLTQVLVTWFDPTLAQAAGAMARRLREAGLRVEMALDPEPIGRQLKYAGRKGIPIAVLLGPDEIAAGEATVRQLEKGEQQRVAQADIVSVIQDWLPR